MAHPCFQSSCMWVPCEYWPGDSGGDGQRLLELSRLLAGKHGSLRNGHGDSAVDWNARLLLHRQAAGHPQVTRRTLALPLPLWIEGHPGVFPGGAQQEESVGACSHPAVGPWMRVSSSKSMWGLQIGHFSAPVLFGLVAFALELSSMALMWPHMAPLSQSWGHLPSM